MGEEEVKEGVVLLELHWTFIQGDNQQKKFFTSDSVEAVIHLNEEHRDILKMQVPLGWERRVGEDRVRGKVWGYLQERGLWNRFLLVGCCGWMVILGSASEEICYEWIH